MMQKLVVLLIMLLVACCVVDSWGPTTHYFMTCQALRPELSVAQCLASPDALDLLSGSDMPDAFFFGPFVSGSACSSQVYANLHSISFAGALVKHAITDASNGRKNFTDLALGFGAHIVGDFAGFFPVKGFLGSGFLNETKPEFANLDNWIALWPLMTSVDAFVVQNRFNFTSCGAAPGQTPHIPSIDANAAKFMSIVAQLSQINMTQKDVGTCSSVWKEVSVQETEKAVCIPPAMYAFEMQYNDQCIFVPHNSAKRPKDRLSASIPFESVILQFDFAQKCGVEAIKIWADAIVAPGNTPQMAALAAQWKMMSCFGKAKCT